MEFQGADCFPLLLTIYAKRFESVRVADRKSSGFEAIRGCQPASKARACQPNRVEKPHGSPALVALAIKLQDMVDRGEVRDYADLARLGYVSRARIRQIMNLLNLAPDIQEEILLRGPDDSSFRLRPCFAFSSPNTIESSTARPLRRRSAVRGQIRR